MALFFIAINIENTQAICIPSGTAATKFISNFSTIGGVQNISNLSSGRSSNSYGNFFPTMSVSQEAGTSFNFSADILSYEAGFRIWIDWNQDGIFNVTTEIALQSYNFAVNHHGTIAIPASATPGNYKMRIVSNDFIGNGEAEPCSTGFTLGEFEDYRVIVVDLTTPCAGTPDPGTTVF